MAFSGNQGAGDIFIGGSGRDSFIGSDASDTLFGGDGSDFLFGKDGDDYLIGGAAAENTALPAFELLSFGRANGVVSATTSVAHGLVVGDAIVVNNQNGFDGIFIITAVSERSFSYLQAGPNVNISRVRAVLQRFGGDVLDGGEGDDLLIGGENENSVGDLLIGGGGNNEITGTRGNDYIAAGSVEEGEVITFNLVNGAGGNDTIFGSSGSDIINVTDEASGRTYFANDEFGQSNVLFTSSAGNGSVGNQLEGNSLIFAGAGNDRVSGYRGDDRIEGEAGDDDLFGYAGRDTLRGGAGNDVLVGGEGRNRIEGGDGNDRIVDHISSSDTVIGGSGVDIFVAESSLGLGGITRSDNQFDFIRASSGEGRDLVAGDVEYLQFSNVTIVDRNADLIFNSYNSEANRALGFDDARGAFVVGLDEEGLLSSINNADVVHALLYKGASDHTVVAAGGEDYSISQVNGNNITANTATTIDLLSPFGDVLGRLTLNADGHSVDFIPQLEAYNLPRDFALQVELTLTNGTNSFTTNLSFLIEADNNFRVVNLDGDIIFGQGRDDYILGNNGDDSLVGARGDDTIIGDGGDDLVFANSGNDRVFAGANDAGRDTLIGNEGDDELNGGAGDDLLIGGGTEQKFDLEGVASTAGINSGFNILNGGAGNDVLVGGSWQDRNNNRRVEESEVNGGNGTDEGSEIAGGGGNDSLYGTRSLDTLSGGDGNDRIIGFSGDDELFGGNGNDLLDGGDGNDFLNGGAGNDSLTGGDGNNVIIGGAGNDMIDLSNSQGLNRLVFERGSGSDSVRGFNVTDDILDLSRTSFDFTTGQSVLARAVVSGGDLRLDLGGGDFVTLIGLNLNDLSALIGEQNIIF